MNKKKQINNRIGIVMAGVMAALVLVQIILCVLFLIHNGVQIQLFEESVRYLNAAVNFSVNGWELIGYVFLISVFRSCFGNWYIWAIFLFQFFVTIFVFFFTMKTWSEKIWGGKIFIVWYILGIAFLISNPFVFQMIQAVLPDILALDIFLLSLDFLLLFTEENGRFFQYRAIGLLGCILLQAILNRYYLWVTLFFLLGGCILKLFNISVKDERKKRIKILILLCGTFVTVGLAWEVNHIFTDYSGYMKYSLIADCTERIIYPKMADDYPSYSGLVKGSLPKEKYLENGDKLWHFKEEVAPLLEREYGWRAANRIYIDMMKTAVFIRTKDIVKGLTKDFIAHFFQIFLSIRYLYHNHDSRYGYNLSRFWPKAPVQAMRYMVFGIYSQAAVGGMMLMKFLLDKILVSKTWNKRAILVLIPAGIYTSLVTLLAPAGADYRLGLCLMTVFFLCAFSAGKKGMEIESGNAEE